MSSRNYQACLRAVNPPQHGSPPTAFLDQLIDAINPLPDSVFAENPLDDIYSVMEGALGPYTSLLQRKAVMCEVLRVQAGFESDWNWNAGVDLEPGAGTDRPKNEWETGAFQVSANSMDDDQSLRDCVTLHAGSNDTQTFLNAMKVDHALAVEYCARLLRFDTTWCGTINNRNQVYSWVSTAAAAEFQTFLQLNGPVPAGVIHGARRARAAGVRTSDGAHIPQLIQLGSNVTTLDSAQSRAERKLLDYDGEVYPTDGCAITLSTLLQDAGIDVPDIYTAIDLGRALAARGWRRIEVGNQRAGDVGSTCGDTPRHGTDHIYLVLRLLNPDEMLVADNQSAQPHFRYASGQGGKTPTTFFLRAPEAGAA